MPLGLRVKKLFSTKKKGERSRESSASISGTTTPLATDATSSFKVEEGSSTPIQRLIHREEVKDDDKQASSSKATAGDHRQALIAIDIAIDIVAVLKEASEASEVLVPLKTASGILLQLLESAREFITENAQANALASILQEHHRFLERETHELEGFSSQVSLEVDFMDALDTYLRALDTARDTVSSIKKRNELSKPKTPVILQVDDVKDVETDLGTSFHEFMRQIHQCILHMSMRTSDQVAKTHLSHLLKEAVNARGERVKPLTPGTRVSLIERLTTWGTSKNSQEQIFWLHDEAGTGKSSIAAHMANKWHNEGALGARFFFDRNGGRELWNIERLCITLAKEMVDNQPLAGVLYFDILSNNPSLDNLFFAEAFTLLVASVAKSLSERTPTPLIFVIDALDECDADDIPILIDFISASLSSLPQVRFLLTSRPTKEITALLSDVPNVGGKNAILLDVKHGETERDHDIIIYVRHTLENFSVADQNTVIQCASGVFLWATLACETLIRTVAPMQLLHRLESNVTHPTMQILYEAALEAALPPKPSLQNQKLLQAVLQGVALTYTPISIFSIQSFFPRNADAKVHGEEYVEYFVKKLGSIMKDGTPYLPIYILHPTFREFIEDQKSGAKFYISPPDGHASISIASMALLTKNLSPDVLELDDHKTPLPVRIKRGIETPARLSSDIEAPLRYAVAFWATHASLAIGEDETIQRLVTKFFSTKLLLWIEWSSATKELSECIEGLRRLQWAARVQSVSEVNATLETWCNDAIRFVLRNSHTLERCGLQAHFSALTFTPAHSLIRKTYSANPLRPLPLLLTAYHEPPSTSRTLLSDRQCTTHVNFSSDGKRLLTYARIPGSLHLWSVKTQKTIAQLKGHTNGLNEAKFSGDGSLIVSCSEDASVCLWDGYTGVLKERLPVEHYGPVKRVEFGLGDTVVVGIGEGFQIVVWTLTKLESPEERARDMQVVGHTGEVAVTAVSPDSRVLATFSTDASIQLWDLESCIGVGRPMVCSDEVLSGVFSVDGGKVIAAQCDGIVSVWDVASQTLVHSFSTGAKRTPAIGLSPKGGLVAAGNNHLFLWDLHTGTQVLSPVEVNITSLSFDKSGHRLVSGSENGHIDIWDLRKSGGTLTMDRQTLFGHTSMVKAVSCSPNARLIGSTSFDGTLRIWNTEMVTDYAPSDHTHEVVNELAISTDGTRLISAGEEGRFQMWDVATGQKTRGFFHSEQDQVIQVLFSSRRTMWATCFTGGKASVWLHESEDTEPLEYPLPCPQDAINCLSFTHNDTHLITGGSKMIIVWELMTRSKVAEYPSPNRPLQIATSNDGKYLAVTYFDSPLHLFDRTTHQQVDGPVWIDPFNTVNPVDYVAFSPDGQTILLQQMFTLQLFDVKGMRCFASFVVPKNMEYSILSEWKPSFSPDGLYLYYWRYVFDLRGLLDAAREGRVRLQPTNASLPPNPLIVRSSQGRVYTAHWNEPILVLPGDVRVKTWITHQNSIAFGSSDGRVFILRFPDESIGPWT